MVQVKQLFPCQKAIIIKKQRPKETNQDVNFSLNKNDMIAAMQDFGQERTAFVLYMYLASNVEDYTFGLSRADVMAATKLSGKSYDISVKTLIEKGYLVYTQDFATDNKGNHAPLYEFHARPLVNFT